MQLRDLSLFTPLSVTVITTVVYLAIVIPLIVVQETVPKAPSNPTPYPGINLTEAWLDLSELTNGYHPYNSRRNDEIRDWLLRRLDAILKQNGAKQFPDNGVEESRDQPVRRYREQQKVESSGHESIINATEEDDDNDEKPPETIVFSDLVANYTGTALLSLGSSGRKPGISTYFEGTNIIVYIRGTEDESGDWWNDDAAADKIKSHGKGGVMVNAHYDSVSTGYGATDDGVGVITALQLVEFFSNPVNAPKKGVVVLFNNGEEDGLYGARAFLRHPMASFVHTFLNLEGAGAGGRATLFRATDLEVTAAYGKAAHPFGNSISADGFSSGFVRSETDYIVFRAEGFRGLDVAFWEPRARYHTDQDDAKHTSIDSLWHMLSQSVSTVKALSSDTSKRFNGERRDHDLDKVQNGKGTAGVWFDLFGAALASFSLRSLFAWSVTILVVTPLILAGVTYFLVRQDKYYFFSGKIKEDDDEPRPLDGWRGATRFPIAFVVATLLTIGAAFLVRKFNPFIIYSSSYTVWIMSLSLYFISFWFIMAGCNFMRPSALHRGYALMWMYIFGWILLFVATIFEDQFKITAGYLFVFYESGIFLAFLITLCEFFVLPTKSSFVEAPVYEPERERTSTDRLIAPTADEIDPTETTPLVGGDGHRPTIGTTFAEGYRRHSSQARAAIENDTDEEEVAFGREQKWSADLPTWTWLIQFLLICPFIIIIFGQVGLLLVTATDQTGTDGSSLILPFLLIAFFSVLLLWPIGPFAHRLTHHIPSFLLLVFVGTLIYNLVAFPFSINNRYKAYFQQNVDLDTGINTVILTGVEEYIRDIISYIPSASGQKIKCESRPQVRSGLKFCSWEGLSPNVVPTQDGIPPEKGYQEWLSFNVTRVRDVNKATFHIIGRETKECILRFDSPISAFSVHGAAQDDKFGSVPENGSDQLKLWHRDWNKEWVVDIEWPVSEGKLPGDEGIQGRVACQWSDQNTQGSIPALEEIYRYAPAWSGVSKLSEGLVEGTKAFVV
ncbi:aminopeptidase-like protein [Xylogone sp. PMI_703]|nr:aminopeptidase-like protein [Xylogone sp. PMI_703]